MDITLFSFSWASAQSSNWRKWGGFLEVKWETKSQGFWFLLPVYIAQLHVPKQFLKTPNTNELLYVWIIVSHVVLRALDKFCIWIQDLRFLWWVCLVLPKTLLPMFISQSPWERFQAFSCKYKQRPPKHDRALVNKMVSFLRRRKTQQTWESWLSNVTQSQWNW